MSLVEFDSEFVMAKSLVCGSVRAVGEERVRRMPDLHFAIKGGECHRIAGPWGSMVGCVWRSKV